MPTQTANHLPTQLNIAPRGKRWKDWQLVDGEIGFPTREAMEKYHCHPERVKSLEDERIALLESTSQLNRLNEQQAAQIKGLEAQMEAIGAGGVEPLRKGMVPLSEVLARLEQGFGPNSAPVTTLQHHFLRSEHGNDAAVQQGVQPSPESDSIAPTLMTNDQAIAWAWADVRKDVGTENWTTGDSCNFYGFFLYGWNYRVQYELQRNATKAAVMREIATHPTQQGLDAQRWQIVHDHISGEYIAGRACFVVHVQPMSGANIMRGSVAEHFTKAVDDIAAQIKIAAQAKQGGAA